MRARHLLAALLCSACLAQPALAQGTNVEQARTYFKAGAQAYKAGEFLAAIQAFEAAYQLAPRPAIIFTIGQAYRRQYYIDKRPGHLKAAIKNYRDYVAKTPTGGRRADAAQALAELEPLAARVSVTEGTEAQPLPALKPKTRLMVSSKTAGARVSLDGGPLQAMPLISEVKPGKHKIRVSAAGRFDETRELVAAEGGVVALDIPLRDKPAVLTISTETGARISLDGRLIGTSPLSSALKLTAGKHLITVAKNGREPFSKEIVVKRGEERTFNVSLPTTSQRVASYVLLGTGAAALITGGVFTGLAYNKQNQATDIIDLSDEENINSGQLAEHNNALDRRDTYRLVAGISLGSGLLIGATGFVLYSFDQPTVRLASESDPEQDEAPPPSSPGIEISAIPVWQPGSTGAALRGTF